MLCDINHPTSIFKHCLKFQEISRHLLKLSSPVFITPSTYLRHCLTIQAITGHLLKMSLPSISQAILITFASCILNSLWPSNAILRRRSGSTLVHVMACCLTAPSHYRNQWCFMIEIVPWHSPKSDITRICSWTESLAYHQRSHF